MTKYNRINSKVVTELVRKHIEEHLQGVVDNYELSSIEELIKSRTKETMIHMIDRQYIGAYDLVEFMTMSALDFEWRTYGHLEFIESININPREKEILTHDRYIGIIAYHMQKMYDIQPVINSVRVEVIDGQKGRKKRLVMFKINN